MRRNDVYFFRLIFANGHVGMEIHAGFIAQQIHNTAVQLVYPGVIKLAGDTAEYRHFIDGGIPGIAVALHLFAHIAQGIEGAAFIEFVDGDDIRKIEHVNFFQLGGCAKFGRHHIQTQVAVVYNFGVTLPDTARFEDNQVVMRCFQDFNGRLYIFGKGQVALAGRERAHVHPSTCEFRVQGIHSNSVAQQRTTGFSFRWIDRNDGDRFIGGIEQKTANEFIHQRRFPSTTCTRNA